MFELEVGESVTVTGITKPIEVWAVGVEWMRGQADEGSTRHLVHPT